MSIALSPAPTANAALPPLANAVAAAAPAPDAAPAKSGATAGPRPDAAPAGESTTAQFQQALQRIVQGSAMPAESTGNASFATTLDPSAMVGGDTLGVAANDDTDTTQDANAAPVSDLLLSGMLLVPITPAVPTAPAMPVTPAAPTASGLPALSPLDASAAPAAAPNAVAAAAVTAQAPTPAAAIPSTLPVLPNALAANPQAAALPSMPAANRFLPANAGAAADDAAALPDATTAPSTPATTAARQSVNLAALASMVTPAAHAGTAREQRGASTLASMDLQNPDIASGIASASNDTAARDANLQTTPASSSARGTHSLAEALGDRIAQQLQRGGDRAVIRLDPPMQGQLEITIHRDASGATQVHLSASNSDVARQLQTISDSLRQELVNRQHGEVTVLVSHGGRDHGGRQGQQQQAPQNGPGRALADAGSGEAQDSARFALSSLED